MLRVFNKAVAVMTANQNTEGRAPMQAGNGNTGSSHEANNHSGYDTKDRRHSGHSKGTGARSGSKTQDDDDSRGQRQEGGVHYKPSRSGNGQSIVNRNIRGKYENRSGTGQSIVNTGGGFRAIFEEEQEETTDPLNTAFDDSNDSDASGNGTRKRRNRGPGGY